MPLWSRGGNAQNSAEEFLATELWRERSQLDELRGILDPGDTRGIKNQYIDSIHRSALAEWGNIGREDRVLDFGCGRGRITRWLASQARSVCGLDLVWEMLSVARQTHNLANVSWVVGEGGALPWSAATFDKVLTVYVLQHILNQEVLAAVLAEFARVLTPGGRVVLLEQVRSNEARTIENYIRQRKVNEYRTVLKQVGLQSVASVPLRAHSVLTHLIGFGLVPVKWFPQAARLDAKLAASTRFNFPYQDCLLVAEKL